MHVGLEQIWNMQTIGAPATSIDNGSASYPLGYKHYPLYDLFLRVLPLFSQSAPGPRPKDSTFPVSLRRRSTRRTISWLTPGHALSRFANCKSASHGFDGGFNHLGLGAFWRGCLSYSSFEFSISEL